MRTTIWENIFVIICIALENLAFGWYLPGRHGDFQWRYVRKHRRASHVVALPTSCPHPLPPPFSRNLPSPARPAITTQDRASVVTHESSEFLHFCVAPTCNTNTKEMCHPQPKNPPCHGWKHIFYHFIFLAMVIFVVSPFGFPGSSWFSEQNEAKT